MSVFEGRAGPLAELDRPADGGAVRGGAAADRVAPIVEALELDIVLGRLHPRERLTEQVLAARFATNRASVRTALGELERKGLIARRRHVGATVVDLRPEEVEQIYRVRELLETTAAAQIAYPVEPEILERLEAIQRGYGEAIDRGDPRTVYRENLRFHTALFAISGNRVLTETIENLAQRSSPIRSYSQTDTGYLRAARDDHRAMIEALRSGERDRLVELCRRHLVPSKEAYIRAYRQRFQGG